MLPSCRGAGSGSFWCAQLRDQRPGPVVLGQLLGAQVCDLPPQTWQPCGTCRTGPTSFWAGCCSAGLISSGGLASCSLWRHLL